MSTSPYVSVVMPVHNGQAYLARALDSISDQTFRDLEIVVVNDGSTDGTASLLEAYRHKEPRLRVYHQSALGLAGALNHACDKATGKYWARMDADDVAYPDRIALQVRYLDHHPCVAVVGTQARLVSPDGQPNPLSSRRPVSIAAVRRVMKRRNALVHPSVMMRAEAYQQTTGYRRAVAPAEDYDLWLRILERHDIANLPTVLLDYTVHDQQVSSSHLQRQIFGALAGQLAAQHRDRDTLDALDRVTVDDLLGMGASRYRIEQALIEGYVEMANMAWSVGNRIRAMALLDTISTEVRSRSGARRLRSERQWLLAKQALSQGHRITCCRQAVGACLTHFTAVRRVLRVGGLGG